MKRIAAVVVVALVGLTIPALAAENVAGTWKWTNVTRESTLKLMMAGDKLTGVYVGGQSNTEIPVVDATIKDDIVSFSVTREINGEKRTTKYSGKLTGDTITGKSERERDGQATSTAWVAKRQK